MRLVPLASDPLAGPSSEASASPPFTPSGSALFGIVSRRSVAAEVGYSTIRGTILLPVGKWFAFGASAFLDAGVFSATNDPLPGTITFGAGLPLQVALLQDDRLSTRLELKPGIGLTIRNFEGLREAAEFFGLRADDTTSEAAAFLLHSSLHVGYRISPRLLVGGGIQIPATLFRGNGLSGSIEAILPDEAAVIPILLGPGIEGFVAPGVAISFDLKMGPHIQSNFDFDDDTKVRFGLKLALGVVIPI
ncbi:MAG: hypothetical protein HC923_07140 [Myxococcales bacterium]|nr:hypothetical protein [Myxococcales bacterium]